MVETGRIKIRTKHHETVSHFKMYTNLYAGDTATWIPSAILVQKLLKTQESLKAIDQKRKIQLQANFEQEQQKRRARRLWKKVSPIRQLIIGGAGVQEVDELLETLPELMAQQDDNNSTSECSSSSSSSSDEGDDKWRSGRVGKQVSNLPGPEPPPNIDAVIRHVAQELCYAQSSHQYLQHTQDIHPTDFHQYNNKPTTSVQNNDPSPSEAHHSLPTTILSHNRLTMLRLMSTAANTPTSLLAPYRWWRQPFQHSIQTPLVKLSQHKVIPNPWS